MRALLAGFLLSSLALAFLSGWRTGSDGVVLVPSRVHRSRSPQELQDIAPSTLDVRRREVRRAPTEAAASEEPDEEDAAREAPERALTIRIARQPSGAAAPGLTVAVVVPEREDAEGFVTEAETDSGGEAVCRLPDRAAPLWIQVRDDALGAVVVEWFGTPAGVVSLEIPDSVLLHCRLELAPEAGLDPTTCSVRIDSERALGVPGQALGSRAFDASGAVVLSAALDPRDQRLVARVFGPGGALSTTILPVREFLDFPGPRLKVDVRPLEVIVRGAPAERLAAAEVRAGQTGEEPARVVSGAPDDHGRVTFLLPPGKAEVCVGLEGYRAAHAVTDVPGPPLALELEPLPPSEVVRCRVRTGVGDPVEGALVTLAPACELAQVAHAAFVQRRTGPDGWASLPAVASGDATIAAYHPEHGVTARYPIQSRAGAEVTLVVEDVCEVELELVPPGAAEVEGEAFWALVDRGLDREWRGRWRPGGRTLDTVPLGDFVVEVYCPGEAAFGVVPLHLAEPGAFTLQVPLRSGVHAVGCLHGGSASEVWARAPGVPDDVSRRWCRGSVDVDGRFSVFVPTTADAQLVVERADGTSLELSVDPLQPIEVSVPPADR